MLYHALRLACITVSSFKTWKAVVDSSNRAVARRYMFLWFLTLTGLSLEPIVDSLLGHWIPMYEGLKITVAGWLLLAHFYLAKPISSDAADTYCTLQDHSPHLIRTQSTLSAVSAGSQRSYQTAASRQLHGQQRSTPTLRENGTISSASNLDFGRFKRDLERRRTSHSVHSATAYALNHSPVISKSQINAADFYPTISASALANPFHVPAKSTVDNRTTFGLAGAKAATEAITALGNRVPPVDTFQFGETSASRKRSLSAVSSHIKTQRSTTGQSSRRRNSDQSFRPTADPADTLASNSRMTKRLKQLLREEQVDETTHGEATSQDGLLMPLQTIEKKQHNAHGDISAQPTTFIRSKPPGRNRKKLLSHPRTLTVLHNAPLQQQNSADKRKLVGALSPLMVGQADKRKSRAGAASFDSRMKNVRDWLKERNPSMISPPLSANSELSIATITRANRQSSTILSPKMVGSTGEIDGLHKPHKRKAFRQLAPSMGSKKLARNEGENCRRGAEQGGTYPPSHETIVSIPRPQLISHSSELSGTLHREYTNKSAVNSSDSNNIYTKAHDPLRDQPETDSFFPPVNWSRFQQQDRARPHTRPPPSVVDADALPSSEFTFRMTPTQISNQAFTRTIGGRDADGVAISPLIRLRQSQLKQRQQEDFLGIKADKNSSSRRAAESGGLTFNETLEAWEREDDEELARNAAREEAEMEALGQHQDGFLSSSSLEEDRKVNPVASNTSASSLLRTVPFNGESSRRPEPSFNSMKPLQEPAAKDSGDAVAKTLPSSLDRQPFNIHGFSSSLGRPDDRHSVLVASESAPEPRLFSSTSQKEDTYNRRQKRPGLYTPSKKNRTFDATTLLDRVPPQSPQTSTPTVMNRYIQLSSLSDEECT